MAAHASRMVSDWRLAPSALASCRSLAQRPLPCLDWSPAQTSSLACCALPQSRQRWRRQLQDVQEKLELGSSASVEVEDARGLVASGLWTEEDMQDFIDPSIFLDKDVDDHRSESGSEQVHELFSLDAGWSVDGTDNAAGDGWAVEGLADVPTDSESDSDWDVASSEASSSGQIQQSKGNRDDDRDSRWASSSALQSLPKEVLRQLQASQAEADEANAATKRAARRKAVAEKRTHTRLRIICGDIAGKKLLSGQGETTRPMMEKVRAAVFDMLLALSGNMARLPQSSRWLDLFAGTGSVGLEALSRGAEQCHFIEMDRWVVDTVLAPNLQSCRMEAQSVVHTTRAEEYLKRAREVPQYSSAFDYISVCPPYLKVSYPELFSLLDGSPLVHDESFILVEYPRKSKHEIPDTIGPLAKIRDRKFGRTYLAVFGPPQ